MGKKSKNDADRTPEGEESLSFQATINRLKDLGDEIRRVADKTDILPEDEEYLIKLEAEFDVLDKSRRSQERAALVEKVDVVTGSPLKSEPGHTARDLDDDPFTEPVEEATRKFANPWDLAEIRTWNRGPAEVGAEYKARAQSAIEQMSGTNDDRRETMSRLIEEWDTDDGRLSRQALVSSSPAYMRAFVKMAKGQEAGLTTEERDAVARAMSLTDSAGGYLVPFQLDSTVIITSDGTLNQIRQAARQVVATGDVWNGISAGETSWGFAAEAAESGDDASTFAQPTVAIHRADGFIPISFEALQDEANVAAEVGRLLASGKDTLEADVFATGTGSGQPYGIVTALNTIAGSIVTATTNNSFGLVDLYAMDEGLPARYRANGSFLANRSIYNDIRQFDSSGGAALWERLGADVPPLLLGRPAFEAESMDGAIATGDDYVLIFGDFDNYIVADRVGMTVEFVPHLFATGNNRPSSQRGWLAWYRVGADSVNNGGFRILHV